MLVNSVGDLQNISTNLAGTYALGKDIDALSVSNFTPLGNFTGILDGHGGLGTNHTISNLTIAPTSPERPGMSACSARPRSGAKSAISILPTSM